jgi:hypothetical protein
MRTGNGKDESGAGRESSVGRSEAGDDRVYSFDGGSTGAVSGILTETQSVNDCTTFGGQDGAGTTPVTKAPWFEPVVDNGCKDGVCQVPWATKPYRPELQPDLVNHPPHYNGQGAIECIDAIEAQLTPEEYRGYLKGNIAKYGWRERHKGGTESLRKARFYLNRLIEFDEN